MKLGDWRHRSVKGFTTHSEGTSYINLWNLLDMLVFYLAGYCRSFALDLCSGGTHLKSWPGHRLLLLKPGSCGWYEGCAKRSVHFEYLENRSRGHEVTWQAVRGDHTVHL